MTQENECPICYNPICTQCPTCIRGECAERPCQCNAKMCNMCWCIHVVTTKTIHWDKSGTIYTVKCPTCRMSISMKDADYSWCHRNVQSFCLIGSDIPFPRMKCGNCDKLICFCSGVCDANNAVLNCQCHLTNPICQGCLMTISRGVAVDNKFNCPVCNLEHIFVDNNSICV